MVMNEDTPSDVPATWLGLPVIATVARILCRELSLHNEYLRLENEILKSKIKGRIRFTDDERRSLVESALAMGRKLMDSVVNIVKPATILAWQRRLEKQKWDYSERRKRKPGRPRTPGDIEALIGQLARENIWGYKKIQGELQKLGIEISKTTVANILRRNGLPPSPDRKGLTWREFLSRHADVFLCADLLTKELWTPKGLQRAFVFFVLHLRTRRILLAQTTFSPNGKWLKQQARHVLWICEEHGIEPRFFLHDNDRCYSHDFDLLLKNMGLEPLRTPYEAPNANAFAERWIRSLRQECLNHLIIFGLSRLQHVLDEYKNYYNQHRPHQGIGNRVPDQCKQHASGPVPVTPKRRLRHGDIQCQEFLGGLLKSYSRRAA
jgi:putative transposase